MEQRLIKNINVLSSGIYFIQGEIKKSTPEPILTIDYDNSGTVEFIKKYKNHLKGMVERSGYGNIFVAYWYFEGGKAMAYICSENEAVNSWFIYYLYNILKNN